MPTKEEMVEALRDEYAGMADGEEELNFDIEAAIYWFASDWHGGLDDDGLYAALSNSPYRPGAIERSPGDVAARERWEREAPTTLMMYDYLVSTYATDQTSENAKFVIGKALQEIAAEKIVLPSMTVPLPFYVEVALAAANLNPYSTIRAVFFSDKVPVVYGKPTSMLAVRQENGQDVLVVSWRDGTQSRYVDYRFAIKFRLNTQAATTVRAVVDRAVALNEKDYNYQLSREDIVRAISETLPSGITTSFEAISAIRAHGKVHLVLYSECHVFARPWINDLF